MDISAYFRRIRFFDARPQNSGLNPDAELLGDLHRAHLFSVPFENLSIHSGEQIQLDLDWIYQKIVKRARGGFCYELNSLFSWLLRELGFEVSLLSARVMSAQRGGFGPAFDHLVLRVDLEQSWLADVGFGECFRDPLRLEDPSPQHQAYGTYRLERHGDQIHYSLLEQGQWQTQYAFTTQTHRLDEFQNMCTYHQTSAASSFTQNWMCSLARPGGRITLTEKALIRTEKGKRLDKKIQSEAEIYALLERHFGISGVELPVGSTAGREASSE